MAFQVFLNLILAFVWMLLHNDWSSHGLIIGYALGILQLVMLRRLWPNGLYLFRLWAIIRLVGLFIRELVKSSYAVIRQVLQPDLTIRPGIFAYQTELESDWEVTLLSLLICLTPGTVTVDFSKKNRTIYIHAMDIDEAESLSAQIRETFEQAIQKVTR